MKAIQLILATVLLTGQLIAQNQTIKPGVRTTFHVVDENGKPISDEDITVEVEFATTDENGNKVPVYRERFLATTTIDGYFQREIGAKFGDLPEVLFGKYEKVDFKDPKLCVRVSFRRSGFNQPLIIGKWAMLSPVPLAAEALNTPAQTISKIDDEISLSNDGGTVVLNDDDPENELQILVYSEIDKTLRISDGNEVDLSDLSELTRFPGGLFTERTIEAGGFQTINGRTAIEPGKISLRYGNLIGQDGIEMGIDEENCTPFMTFIDCEGNTLGSFRMGPDGFKFYPGE